MSAERQHDYQYGYAERCATSFDLANRERKARTIAAILADFLGTTELATADALDVGASTGIIDHYLADHVGSITGMDIDEPAIEYARNTFAKPNLSYRVGDALNIDAEDGRYGVAICSHVYEHVPDASRMMREIMRILKPGGICYFAPGNRLAWNEPHYNLPLLSVVPRPLAHRYLKLSGRGDCYYEKHRTYWGLRRLAAGFDLHDYTLRVIQSPTQFFVDYMVAPGSTKQKAAMFIARYVRCLCPSYMWVLEKPPVSR